MASHMQNPDIVETTDSKGKEKRIEHEIKGTRETNRKKNCKDKEEVVDDVSKCHAINNARVDDQTLHKRRYESNKNSDIPETLTLSAQKVSDDDNSSPSTAFASDTPTWNESDVILPADPMALCDEIIKSFQGNKDFISNRCVKSALSTKSAFKTFDKLDHVFDLVDNVMNVIEFNDKVLEKLRRIDHVKQLIETRRILQEELDNLLLDEKDVEKLISDFDTDEKYNHAEQLFESLLGSNSKSMKPGSRWKSGKIRGSILRKQRSRSAGGEDSDGVPLTPLRRSSEDKINKSKISKWTKVKAAFKWEKAQVGVMGVSGVAGVAGGAAGVVGAAGALAGAVALAGTVDQPQRSASLTPGSLLSLTPESSCEELRIDTGGRRKSVLLRCDDHDNAFLQAPTQDDSSTSPSPNKLHKTPWGKMRDIIQTRKESVKKKQNRASLKSSPDVVPARRRSFSDGGESDAPPALTLTIPSSEELESEGPSGFHQALRKQRSLELGGAGRPPLARRSGSKWSKVKRAFLTSAASVPSSPSRHSAFFTDAETEGVSSGCEAGGVRDEIQRDYAALQSRLTREFFDRQEKLYTGGRPVATEEQLSADFRKKLAEWQRLKAAGASSGSARQPPPVPDRSDLSDEFLKKWDEWKLMKEHNSVQAWGEEDRPDEVLVHTSTGFFKFQGISRSFTRKLHEWEKAQGIAPEASTSALLKAAKKSKSGPSRKPANPQPLVRAQSAGSVAPSQASAHTLHASSLSVNDADDLDFGYDHENITMGAGDVSEVDGTHARGAVLVEVEAEEVCTAAPLVAVTPRHCPQTPVYTYDHAEPARHLCETTAAFTGTALGHCTEVNQRKKGDSKSGKLKEAHKEQGCTNAKKTNSKRKVMRQPSIEEDAKFIRRTIEEIERGSSNRYAEEDRKEKHTWDVNNSAETHIQDPIRSRWREETESPVPASSKASNDSENTKRQNDYNMVENRDIGFEIEVFTGSPKSKKLEREDSGRRKDEKNGKKKIKSRARLEREASKPSESDSEPDAETVTVEIPKRRKKPRKTSDKPKTPPISTITDSEGEIYVLKLQTPGPRESSPEVIVKTTRKIFSPVVRSGEVVPRAVIPVNVDDLPDVRQEAHGIKKKDELNMNKKENQESKVLQKKLRDQSRVQDDALDTTEIIDEQKSRSRPPLPSSPSAQRRPPPKETAPSIRIMIQRYNMKINEEGQTSGPSSGTSSPAWRSPAAERRRPPDMPARVTIRNNPFVEREVQKSLSACQLSRKEQSSSPKLQFIPPQNTNSLDGVLKSQSACALTSVDGETKQSVSHLPSLDEDKYCLQINPNEINKQVNNELDISEVNKRLSQVFDMMNEAEHTSDMQAKDTILTDDTGEVNRCVPCENGSRSLQGLQKSKATADILTKYKVGPSVSLIETTASNSSTACTRPTERAQKIRAARERFLSSPGSVRRRDLSGSAGNLGSRDRSSKISCDSEDASESSGFQHEDGAVLGRSASTGMVNVDRAAYDRVCEGSGGGRRRREGKFSLARLAARLRRRGDDAGAAAGAVSRLCRQSLVVQIKPN